MSDPAGKEKRVVGLRKIFRLEAQMGEKVASVVKRHDDHDKTSHDVDGINSAQPWNLWTADIDWDLLQS
jgi:hypothetical protein